MTWIVWRQQRPLFITLAIALVVGVAAILILRAMMTADIDEFNLAGCVIGGSDSDLCEGTGITDFQDNWFDLLRLAQVGVLVLPVLAGIFVGAPLFAREFEQGTYALVFTQSVSRVRWIANKILVTAPPVLLAVVIVQAAVEYWVSAAGQLGPLRLGVYNLTVFDTTSVSPAVYTLFAFAFGMFAGAVSKRTLLAMPLTFVVYIAVMMVVDHFREYLVPKKRVVDDTLFGGVHSMDGWTVKSGYLDTQGQEVLINGPVFDCGGGGRQALEACYHEHGIAKSFVDLIPNESARALHLAEGGIFLVLAALCIAGTVWAVRRQN